MPLPSYDELSDAPAYDELSDAPLDDRPPRGAVPADFAEPISRPQIGAPQFTMGDDGTVQPVSSEPDTAASLERTLPQYFTLGGELHPIEDQSTRPLMPRAVSERVGLSPEMSRWQDIKYTLPSPGEFAADVMEPTSIAGAGKGLTELMTTTPEDLERERTDAQSIRRAGEQLGAIPRPEMPFAPTAKTADSITPAKFDEVLAQAPEIKVDFPTAFQNELAKAAEELTTGENQAIMVATMGAGTLPKIGAYLTRIVSGYFGYEGAKSVIEGARKLREATTPEEKAQAWGGIVKGAAIGLPAGAHAILPRAKPVITEQAKPLIENAEATGALSKAVTAAKEVAANFFVKSDETQPKEVKSAIQEPSATEGVLRQERPEVGLREVRQPQVETAIPREPARSQGGEESALLLKETGTDAIKRVEALPDTEAVKLDQKAKSYEGMIFAPEDVPALIAARDASGARLNSLFEAAAKPDASAEALRAAQAEYGRNVWLSGAIEIANKKGPNYAAMVAEKAAAKPLPEPAGQIKAGEEQPTPAETQATYAAGAKVIADKLRAQFKTETGGKAFTGPVEIINAAVEVAAKVIEYGGSAADAMAAAVKHIRTNWKGEFDEAAFRTRFDEAIKVPDTRGENVKMRKSAERATTPREAPPAPTSVEVKVDTLTADVARERTIAAEKKALLDSEDIMTLGENPKWMELSKEFEDIKNRYQGRKPSDVVAEQPKAGTILTVPENVSGAGAAKPSLFREASAQDVDSYVNPGTSASTPYGTPEIYASTSRDLALGQGKNKSGIIVEFDPTNLDVREPKTQKPGSAFVEQQGGGAEKFIRAQPHQLRDKVKSITVPKSLGRNPKDPYGIRLRRHLDQNWSAEVSGDTIIYRPKAVAEPARAAAFFERESEAAGLGRSSLPPTVADVRAQRARDAATPDTIETQPLDPASGAPVPAKVPDTAGTNVKMRKSAERATTAPEIPKPVQERIEAAPESRYTQQSMARVEDAVKAMPDAELAAISADSNLYVASKLEQADRRFRAGDNDAGYAIFVELEKQGTSFGQNINQFKRLAATKPEFVATLIDKKLTKAGKDPLTPAQRAQAIETTRKAKAADLDLDKSTDAWTKKPTAENAAKAEAALDKANAEAVELQKFVAKFEPRSTSAVLKSVLQGNLLTPISEVANLFGNMSFLPFRALDRAVGTGLDIIDSAVRGKPRELSVQPLAGTAEALKGVGRGLKQIPAILIEGTGNVIKGETRAGLHPIRAWINQFAKKPEMPTTKGQITLKDRLNLAIEGTFGVPAEAMLRGLGAGDVPFKEGARARVTAEQLKLNNVPRDQWGFAQKFPELFLPKEALQQIHKDTMAAVFQRESKTLNYLTNLAKSKGGVLDFFIATVAPYKLTPWNIVGEILSYNPLIALTRGVYDGAKGNSRGAKLNAGKMVVGSMLTGTGIWLYKNGLLAPSLDERDEAQKARVLSGKVLPPNHINISGLKRATAGGDPTFKAGDETVDVFRAGGLAGAMFYMTANIGRDMERGPKATDSDMWMNIIRQSTLEQARFGLNQSFLSGVEGLLTAIKEGSGDNFLRQWASTAGSIVLPNTLNTLSRASRKYQVDTKADDFKDKIGNMVKTKLGFAGLDDYLPLKRDFWGKPMLETPEGRDAIFYHFFDISKNKQVTSDPVELELYRLWRKTGDSAVIPSLPQRDITLGKLGYALNPQQYERYSELVGTNRRNIVDALAINPQFHKLDDERKMKILERAYRDGMERGKALFYREFNGQLTPKQGRAGFTP